jgi:hypothetical protein
MTSDLEHLLEETAKHLLGDARKEELQADIAKLATELTELRAFSITIHDEA